MSTLDDLKFISQKDSSDALGVAEKQLSQLAHNFDIEINTEMDIDNIVFAGMGGSALAALMAKSVPGYKVPFEIVRNYDIPSYVNGKTLFIASSYSGNTEETLSALAQAEEAGAQVVVIAAGGKLGDIAEEKGYPMAELPGGIQPRMAAFYSFRALATVLDSIGQADGLLNELEEVAIKLKDLPSKYRADVLAKDNRAKQIAEDLMGKSVVVYGGPLLFPVAYKWKISFNENAKNVAWVNQYPEFDHNEFIGWSSHPVEKVYGVIDLVSSFEHAQVQKRFKVSDKHLSGLRPHPITVEAEGESLLEQMVSTIVLGDFTSLYLAILNDLDPTPVDLIEKLKKDLV